MTRSEKVAMLMRSQQLYSYDDWYNAIGYAYNLLNSYVSPAEEYAKYVEETIAKYNFGSKN